MATRSLLRPSKLPAIAQLAPNSVLMGLDHKQITMQKVNEPIAN
jgi:hypothetical protein